MKKQLAKYLIIASGLCIVWVLLFTYSFLTQKDEDGLFFNEMYDHGRHTSEQITEIFQWFEEKQQVFVPIELSGIKSPAPGTVIQERNGRALAMPLPIDLADKLENQIENGVNIRFVSNNPINSNHLASSSVNEFLMKSIESQTKDYFAYRDDVNLYSYVRPLTATKTCISCHVNIAEGELIGAVVIDIDYDEYINEGHISNYQTQFLIALASFFGMIILYFIILDIWRRYRTQDLDTERAQAIAASMSQEIELAISSMSAILEDLKKDQDDPQKRALFQSLQTINKNLLDTSLKAQTEGSNTQEGEEEVFHVKEFFEQCAHSFYPQCSEKKIDLNVEVDGSVPTHLLGNTYYLRQAVVRMLKNSVQYTQKGGIKLRVRSAVDIPSRFSTKDLNHIPMHLQIEVEDTSNGYVVTENQNLLKKFATPASSSNRKSLRPIISLSAINELAEFLDGHVSMLHSSRAGACFQLTAQVKIIAESKEVELAENTSLQANANQKSQEEALDTLSLSMQKFLDKQNDEPSQGHAPIDVILVDTVANSKEAKAIWKKENINVTAFTTSWQVYEAIANANHKYSIIFIREAEDIDIFYLATRIRYVENPNAKPVAIVLIAENIIRTDMEVMRFFNVSTVDKFARDPHVLTKLSRLISRTPQNKILQSGKLFEKTNMDINSTKLFDRKQALENAKNDKKLLSSIVSMWIRFYPKQVRQLSLVIKDGDHDELLRTLMSVKNSANTLSLPMLWSEANRVHKKSIAGDDVLFDKLFSIYEQSFRHLKEEFKVNTEKEKVA